MGQTSSQIVPTQAPEPAGIRESLTDGTPFSTPHAFNKKRAAPESDGEAPARKLKKAKKNGQEPSPQRRLHRAVPQHRRGTAIKPRDEDLVEQQLREEVKRSAREQKTVPLPAIPSIEPSHPDEATRVTRHEEAVAEMKPPRPVGAQKAIEKEAAAPQSEDTKRTDVSTHGNKSQLQRKEGTIVNTIGNPGPRRRKKMKKSKPPEVADELFDMECVPDTQLEPVETPVQEEPVHEGPVREESIREEPVQEESIQETPVQEEPVQEGPVQEESVQEEPSQEALVHNQTTEDDIPAAPGAGISVLLKDGMPVNPVGKPGPRRKQKKRQIAKPSSQAKNVPTPQAKRPDESLEISRTKADASTAGVVPASGALTDGLIVRQVGNPDPPKRKKNKVVKPNGQDQTLLEPQLRLSMPGSDGLTVNPVGNPGPKRRKRKRQLAGASVLRDAIDKREQQAHLAPSRNRRERENITQADDRNAFEDLPEIDFGENRSEDSLAGPMPTPPDSREDEDYVPEDAPVEDDDGSEHEEHYDPTIREHFVDPAPKITTWLNSQDAPAPPDQLSPERKVPEQNDQPPGWEFEPVSNLRPRLKGQGDRRVKLIEDGQDTGPQAMRRYATLERGTVKGPWSAEEKKLADKVFNAYCQKRNISAEDLRAKTVDWTNTGAFKTDMYEAFPTRNINAIRKFCQRRYTPHSQGEWTEEQLKALKEAYAVHPDQWTEISAIVGRTSASCRDRWRHIVQYEDTMERGAWSTEEEAKLVDVMIGCIGEIEGRFDDLDPARDDLARVEKEIDWHIVSSKMEGKRSARRCSEKWQKLRRRHEAAKAQEDTIAVTQIDAETGEKTLSNKQKRLDATYNKLGAGDFVDALDEIWAAMSDQANKQFHDESTFWSLVATKLPDSKFPGKLRRRMYYGALTTYDCKKVQKKTGIARKARALSKALKKYEKKGRLNLTRVYKADSVPDENTNPMSVEERDEARRQNALTVKKFRKQYLSENLVGNSDDESESAHAGAEEEVVEDSIEVPETQDQQLGDGVEADYDRMEEMEVVDDLPVSSLNSRYEESLRSGTPYAHPDDFLERCKAVGRRQHREYMRER